jgi:hypothetical protein
MLPRDSEGAHEKMRYTGRKMEVVVEDSQDRDSFKGRSE